MALCEEVTWHFCSESKWIEVKLIRAGRLSKKSNKLVNVKSHERNKQTTTCPSIGSLYWPQFSQIWFCWDTLQVLRIRRAPKWTSCLQLRACQILSWSQPISHQPANLVSDTIKRLCHKKEHQSKEDCFKNDAQRYFDFTNTTVRLLILFQCY